MSATASESIFNDHHTSVAQQQQSNNNSSRESATFPHSAFGSSFSRHSKKPRISKQDLLNKFYSWQSSSLSDSLPEGFTVWSTVTSQTILPPVNTTDLFKWDSNTRINPDPAPKPKSTTLSSERGIGGSSRGRGRGRGGGGLGRLNTHHNPRPDMLTSPSTPPMQPLWAQDDEGNMNISNNSTFKDDTSNTFDTFGGDAKSEGFSLESMAANTQRMTDSWKSAFNRPHHQQQNETPSSVLSSPALEDNSWRKKTPLRDEEPQTLKMPENIDFDSLWLYSTPDKAYQGPFTLEKLRDWANNGYFSADIVCVQPYTPSDNEQHKKRKGYLVLKHVIEAAEEYERKRSVEDVLLDDDDHVQGVVGVIMDEHHHHPHAIGHPHAHHAHPHHNHGPPHLPPHAHPGNMLPPRAAFSPHVRPGPHIPQQQPQQPLPRGSAPHQQFPHVGPHGWNPHMIPPHQYEMMLRMQQQHQNQQSPQFMPPQAVMQQAWGFNTGVPTPLPEDIMSAEKIENELKYALSMQRQAFLQQQLQQQQLQQQIHAHQEQQQQQSAAPVQNQSQPEHTPGTTIDHEPVEVVNKEVVDTVKPEPSKHGYVLDDDTFVPPSSASLVIEPTPLMMNEEPEQKDKSLKKKKKKKSKSKTGQESEVLVNPLPHQPSDEQFEEFLQQKELYEEEEVPEPVAVKPKQPKPKTEITIISTPATWGSAPEPSATISTIDVLKEESKQKRKQEKEKKKNAVLNKSVVESQEAWPKAYAMPAQSILDIQQEQTVRREQDKTEQQRAKVLVPGSGQNVSIWGMGALSGATPAPQVDDSKKKKKKPKKEKKKKTQQGADEDNEDNGHQEDDDMFWNYEDEKEHKPAPTTSIASSPTTTFSSKDFPAPKTSTTSAVASTSAKKEKKAATKKNVKPAANFSYASVLSSASSRPATTIAAAISTPAASSRVIDNSQFPSLSKKAPAPTTTPTATQPQSASSYVNDFPLPIKKAQSKNAVKKASKKK